MSTVKKRSNAKAANGTSVVKSVEIVGAPSRKIACFKQKFVQQMFIMEILEKVTDEEYEEFNMRFAGSQEEINSFREAIKACNLTLEEKSTEDDINNSPLNM